MNDKFAVLIVGDSNSGKTTTIKHFEHKYQEFPNPEHQFHQKLKKVCRRGRRHIFLYEEVRSLINLMYFVPSSPTESKKALKDNFPYFKFILMAEQKDGSEYEPSIKTLEEHGYEIAELRIDSNSEPHWHKQDEYPNDSSEVYDKRCRDIAEKFRGFIQKRIFPQ